MATKSGGTQAATASYIENMLIELRTMGQQIECDFLVYLLEMSAMEASAIAKGVGSTGRTQSRVVEKPKTVSADELATLFMAGELD